MSVWYELEILEETPSQFYPVALYNRSDQNAGFDLHASAPVMVGSTPEFIPFGVKARLLKVEQMPNGQSNDC